MIKVVDVSMPKLGSRKAGCGALVEWRGDNDIHNPCIITYDAVVSLRDPARSWSYYTREAMESEGDGGSAGENSANYFIEQGMMTLMPKGAKVTVEFVQDWGV